MSRCFRNLVSLRSSLVRVLPVVQSRMRGNAHSKRLWRGDDFRIICSCQVHARRQKTLWRRSLRLVSQLRARSIALLVGVPLALGSLQFPTEAMDVTIGKTMLRDGIA